MVGVTEVRTAFTLSAWPEDLETQADQRGLFSEPEWTMLFWNIFLLWVAEEN